MSTIIAILCCTLVLGPIEGGKINRRNCESCEEESTQNIRLQVIADSGYFIPNNQQEKKVAILDYRHNISGLYDGTTGDAFLFSYEAGTAVHIPRKSCDKTWYAQEKSYENYFQKPFPPTELYLEGIRLGHQFDPTHVSEEMAEKMSVIFTPMSADYSSKCEALATALHISKITSDGYKTTLKNLEKVVGDINVESRGDFKWLIGATQGLRMYFAPFGSIDVLNQKHVQLDYGKFLTRESGFFTLSYLIETLSSHFDLGKITGEMMNSELEFFILLNKLGGEIEYNFDGLIYVLTEITKYNYNDSSKGDVKITLRRYVTDPRGNSSDVKTKWQSGLQILRKTIKQYHLEESFKDLVKRLDDMIEGNWKQKGVDMSAIVKRLLQIELPGKAQEADEVTKMVERGK